MQVFCPKQLANLEKTLDYKFQNYELAEEALSHPSLKQHDPNAKHYEKLELLGDSILGFIVTEMIFSHSKKFGEGEIAKIKAHIVSKETLAEVAKEIHLADYMIMTNGEEKSGGRTNINNLENTMEALIAAIYLDSNINRVRIIIDKLWHHYLNEIDLEDIDPKSHLQELTHEKFKTAPKYEVINRSGEAHAPIFTVKASVKEHHANASSGSIKNAEKEAAKLLLKQLY